MSAINDGGAAFPSSPTVGPNGDLLRPVDIGCEGASLRDYFAADADVPEHFIASCLEKTLPSSSGGRAPATPEQWFAVVARLKYMQADAMLKARGEA